MNCCCFLLQRASNLKGGTANGKAANGTAPSPTMVKGSVFAHGAQTDQRDPGGDAVDGREDVQQGQRDGITGQTSKEGAHLKTHYTKDSFLCPSGALTFLANLSNPPLKLSCVQHGDAWCGNC